MKKISSFTGLAAGLAALALTGMPVQAENVKARYSVSLIGLPLGTAGLTARIDAGQYRVEANARLSGIASMVSNSRGAAVSTGGISSAKPTPSTYATTSSSSTMTRTVRMALNSGNVRAVDISPPLQEHPERVPVTEGHKRSVIDPLSALVMPVPGKEPLVGPAACNRTIPVYDGYTRFDVALSYSATREVSAAGYSGPAVVCSARYVPVSGHRADRKVTQFMADNRDMEVWLVPLQSARVMLPFRISVATMVGRTVIEAEEFSVTATNTRSAAR
jgi:hypothetical protein